MSELTVKKAILISIVGIICVGLLIGASLFPIFAPSGEKGTDTSGSDLNISPLTTYEESIIDPETNTVNGLTTENWFSEELTDEELNFITDNIDTTEFNSTENDDRGQDGVFGGEETNEPGTDLKDDDSLGGSTSREIEEADIIKLVDDTLYILNSYRGLIIVDVSSPDEPKYISRVPMFGSPVEMYIVEPMAYIILTHYSNTFLWAEDTSIAPEFRYGSEIVIIDMSDLNKPKVQQFIEIDGFITDSRRVGEVIYAVANNYNDYYYIDFGVRAISIDTEEEVDEVSSDDEPIPKSENRTEDREPIEEDQKEEEAEEPTTNIGVDKEEESEPQQGTVVMSINFENLNNIYKADQVWFPGSSNEIHVTEEAIFVAKPEYSYSYDEFEYKYEYFTNVTYVDISDYDGDIKVRDTFKVEGTLNDRYQMDYFKHTFRIVTHFWEGIGESKLWVYNTKNPDMITKLGELLIDDAGSLMATRFAGERAYTIHLPRSVDPLDVIDLSDSSNPVLTDILEIPGWVEHMEVRGLKILALGVDDSDGKRKVAASLFDVTDPENAIMKDRVIIGEGYSWSSANWDPKALTVVDDQNLMLIPFESYTYNEYSRETFSGLQIVIFDLENNDLTDGGSIEHMGAIQRTRANSERIFAISNQLLQVIDAQNFDKPIVTATLELCNNIVDVIPMGDYCIQVIADDYYYYEPNPETRLRTVPATEPDTMEYLAEKTVNYNILKTFVNGNFIYLVGSEYSETESKYIGRVVVFDYSNPKAPVLRSNFVMEYFQESYYYGYYYGGWYYSDQQVTDQTFSLVDGDLLVYHPPMEWVYAYDESEIDHAEENKTSSGSEQVVKTTQTFTEKLYFIDLSDPDKPTDVANIIMEDTHRITGLYSNGKTLYFTQYEDLSSYDDSYRWHYEVKYYLTSIDLTDPTKATPVGPINIPGDFLGTNDAGTVIYTRSSTYDEETYYWQYLLNILELNDNTATLKSVIDLGEDFPTILIQDTTIVIGYGGYYYRNWGYLEYDVVYDIGMPSDIKEPLEPTIKTKLQIINAADPSNLKLVTAIGLKHYCELYRLENDKLYLRLSDGSGLIVYDLSTPAKPEFKGYFPHQGWVSNLRENTKAGRVYLACGWYGVFMIEI
jgi:hypothetical protein